MPTYACVNKTKKKFSGRVLSLDLHWKNKKYQLKRSISARKLKHGSFCLKLELLCFFILLCFCFVLFFFTATKCIYQPFWIFVQTEMSDFPSDVLQLVRSPPFHSDEAFPYSSPTHPSSPPPRTIYFLTKND